MICWYVHVCEHQSLFSVFHDNGNVDVVVVGGKKKSNQENDDDDFLCALCLDLR